MGRRKEQPDTSAADAGTSTLETIIAAQYPRLTQGQRRLADFVLQNRGKVAFMSAREFARVVDASDAAVVRFAQALGYEGLGAFRAMLRHELLQQHGRVEATPATSSARLDRSLADRVMECDHELMASTIASNEWDVFASMAHDIASARLIRGVAHGTTYPMACYLAMSLNELLGNVDTLTAGAGDVNHRLLALGPSDVVIAITFPRYNRYTAEIVQLARERGARILALTDGPASIIAAQSDRLLSIAHGVSGSVWSHAGTLAAANLLVSAVEILAGDRAKANLVAADTMLDRIGLQTRR